MIKRIKTLEQEFPSDDELEELSAIVHSQPRTYTKKVIISGNVFEVYDYEFPIKKHKNQKDTDSKRAMETNEEYRERIIKKMKQEIDDSKKDKSLTKIKKIHEKSLFRAKQNVRRIITSNAWKHKDIDKKYYTPQFITFTFKENITDLTEANYLFNKYIKRLNYELSISNKRSACYITTIEFQKRGAVHYHTIFFNLDLINLKEEFRTGVFAKKWGHGFIKVKHIKEVGGVAYYLTKYLTKDNMDKRLISRKKYFCSRSVLRPFEITIQHLSESIIKQLQTHEESYSNRYTTPSGNNVKYGIYNLTDNEKFELDEFRHMKIIKEKPEN